MMLKKIVINQNGVSLMETVVAASISIIIAMGVVRINQNASKGMSRIMTKNDIVDFKQDLKRKLSLVDEATGEQACVKRVGLAFGTNLKLGGILLPGASFSADGSEKTFTVGKSIPSAPALTLISARRQPFNSGAVDSNQGRCDIELEVTNTRNTTKDKTFIIKIPMVCGIVDKSANNYTMTSCTASNSSLDEGLGKMIQDGANRDIMAFEGGTGGAFMVVGDTSLADLDSITSTLTLLPKAGVNDSSGLNSDPSAMSMIAGSTLGWTDADFPGDFSTVTVGIQGNKTDGYLDLIAQQIDLYASSSTPITLKSGSIDTNGGGISTANGQIRTYDGAIQTTGGSFLSSSGNFTTTSGNFTTTTGSFSTKAGSITTANGDILATGVGSVGVTGTGGIKAYGSAGISVSKGIVRLEASSPGLEINGARGIRMSGSTGIAVDGSAGFSIHGNDGIKMVGTLSAGKGLNMTNGDITARDITSRSIYTVGVMYTSDERLKKEIDQLGFVSDKLDNIRGVTYFMRADEFPDMPLSKDRQIGLLAQEVELFFPELVKVNPATGFKSVSYAGFVPILLEAVKEQRAEALENRKMLKFLEKRVSIKDNEQDIRIEALERENKQLKLELKELRRKLDLLLQERLE